MSYNFINFIFIKQKILDILLEREVAVLLDKSVLRCFFETEFLCIALTVLGFAL